MVVDREISGNDERRSLSSLRKRTDRGCNTVGRSTRKNGVCRKLLSRWGLVEFRIVHELDHIFYQTRGLCQVSERVSPPGS